MALADEKYVVVTTLRASGAGVPTTTWITPLEGGRVGFWTSSASGKVKRLRRNSRVTIQPSDARGRVTADSSPIGGVVELVTSGPEFDAIQRQIKAKYGVMVPLSRFFNVLGHLGKGRFPYADLGVVITLDSGPADSS
jgi:PPOX class probable F420-dependent enzyme